MYSSPGKAAAPHASLLHQCAATTGRAQGTPAPGRQQQQGNSSSADTDNRAVQRTNSWGSTSCTRDSMGISDACGEHGATTAHRDVKELSSAVHTNQNMHDPGLGAQHAQRQPVAAACTAGQSYALCCRVHAGRCTQLRLWQHLCAATGAPFLLTDEHSRVVLPTWSMRWLWIMEISTCSSSSKADVSRRESLKRHMGRRVGATTT